MKKITSQDFLIDELRQNAESYRQHLLSIINSGVISLFWNIGNLIDIELKQNDKANFEIVLLNQLSRFLSPVFGNHLNTENLLLMKMFANKCTSNTVQYIAAAINLKYLPHFLILNDDKAWVFYMKLIHTDSLTPTELEKKINENFITGGKNLNEDKYTFLLSRAKPFYQSTFELYFKDEEGEDFIKLFEPKAILLKNFDLQATENVLVYNLITNIYGKVLAFQSEFNHELNIIFNLMHWELGNEIIHLSKKLKVPLSISLNNPKIIEIYNSYSSSFIKKEIPYCLKFAITYPDEPPISELIQTVSWPYIKILLEIDDVDKQKYIASQVLKNGMSVKDLNEMIKYGSLDFELTSEKIQEKIVKKSVNVTTITEKNFNITVTGTMETIESNINPEHDLNRNIFKNPDLLKFLKESHFN